MPSRRHFLSTPALAAVAQQTPAVTAEIRGDKGKPTLFLNGRATYPGFFALADGLGGRWSWEELPTLAMEQFTQAGFRLFQVDLFLESVWPKPGPLQMDVARRQLRGVLDVCPNAAIVIRWHLNAPRWWTAQHEKEWTRYANGEMETIGDRTQPLRIIMDDLRRQPRASLASTAWRDMATAKTTEFLRALARTPEGRALAGVHVACGVYGEWHYWGFMRNEPDTSAPMQAHFDQWRRQHGKAPVRVPGMEERRALDDGIFRDPARREPVIDYYRAQQELVADLVLHFCRVVKRNWPRKLLTGAFYGYFFSVFDRSATGGHLCVEKVLASPDIDYLSAPQAYGEAYRGLGGSGITRGLTESARYHNKLFLDEMDQTPSWQWQNSVDTAFRLTDLEADIAILRRNTLASFTRGTGLWFYDYGPANAAGWWGDRRLMEEIARIKTLVERYHQREYRPAADVLLVFDTEVFYYTASIAGMDPLTDRQAVNQTIIAAFASGAAVETIHLSDLGRVDLSRFRVVVFGNTWLLNANQRRFLREKVMGGGRHVVFQGWPGYCDGERLSLELAREATGLELEKYDALRLRVKGEAPGLARRAETWFSSEALTAPAQWRQILRDAGAHLYVDTGDVVHAGAGLVLVHTKEGGARRVRFRGGAAKDVVLPPKSSWVFDAETGERVL